MSVQAYRDGFAYWISDDKPDTSLWRMDLESCTAELVNTIEISGSIISSYIDTRNDLYCVLHASEDEKQVLVKMFDLESGELQHQANCLKGDSDANLYNPVDGLFYGISTVKNGSRSVKTLNPWTGVSNLGSVVLEDINNNTSVLDYNRGYIYSFGPRSFPKRVDVKTGEMKTYFESGLRYHDYSNFQFDPLTGDIYFLYKTNNFSLLEDMRYYLARFDPETGETEKFSDIVTASTQERSFGNAVNAMRRRIYLPSYGLVKFYDMDGERLKFSSLSNFLHMQRFEVYQPYDLLNPAKLFNGKVIADQNNNCVIDASDVALANLALEVNPGNIELHTSPSGEFRAYLPEGKYTIELKDNDLWRIGCESDPAVFEIDSRDPAQAAAEILVSSKQNLYRLETSLIASRAIAGRDIQYHIQYWNSGTVEFNGALQFQHDDILTSFSSNPVADRYSAALAGWDINNLPVGASRQIRVELKIPGDESLRGRTLCAETKTLDQGGVVLSHSLSNDEFCDHIRAAYDPNDIAVAPRGMGESGMITPDYSHLAYTIRFQNIGDAPARDVIVLDTLDSELDLRELQFGAASHAYTVKVLRNRVLEFRFEDIELPGKAEDEAGSQGFLKFKVGLTKDLPLNTEIHNQAAIYFDFNSPVLTNTVLNTIGQLTTDVLEYGLTIGEQNVKGLLVHSDGRGYILVDSERALSGEIRVYSIIGTSVLQHSFDRRHTLELDLSAQPAGQYLVQITSDGNTTVKSIVVLP